jgi:hypothetical protein
MDTKFLQELCQSLVQRGEFYMAAVVAVALGEGHDWTFLPLSYPQRSALTVMNSETATNAVREFCYERM